MKDLFNTKSLSFTEYVNFILSLRYLRLTAVGYGGNWTFSYKFMGKNIQNGPNNDFLESIMVQTWFLMIFRVSSWFISYKTPQIPDIYQIFWGKFEQIYAIFAQKRYRALIRR